MGSYTNVSVEMSHDYKTRLREENEVLDFKLKQAHIRISYLESVLENIPKALKEWGYVDFEVDKNRLRLVEKKEESHESGA